MKMANIDAALNFMFTGIEVLYISELTQGTNRSLVSFTSLVISSDNVNRGLVLFTMSASFTSLVTIKSLVCKLILINRSPPPPPPPPASNRVNTVYTRVCVCVGTGGGKVVWVLVLLMDGSQISIDHSLFLPPTTPTSSPSCEWAPGVSWGANHGSFLLNTSGPGGTSSAHTTCCEKVAGPPASS